MPSRTPATRAWAPGMCRIDTRASHRAPHHWTLLRHHPLPAWHARALLVQRRTLRPRLTLGLLGRELDTLPHGWDGAWPGWSADPGCRATLRRGLLLRATPHWSLALVGGGGGMYRLGVPRKPLQKLRHATNPGGASLQLRHCLLPISARGTPRLSHRRPGLLRALHFAP